MYGLAKGLAPLSRIVRPRYTKVHYRGAHVQLGQDSGNLAAYEVKFNKKHKETRLRLFFSESLRAVNHHHDCACKWEIHIDGKNCPSVDIFGQVACRARLVAQPEWHQRPRIQLRNKRSACQQGVGYELPKIFGQSLPQSFGACRAAHTWLRCRTQVYVRKHDGNGKDTNPHRPRSFGGFCDDVSSGEHTAIVHLKAQGPSCDAYTGWKNELLGTG